MHTSAPPVIELLIAGAAKAGTTSLKEYLGQHHGICTHRERGISFFDNDAEYEAGYARAFDRYFGDLYSDDNVLVAKSVRVLYSTRAMERLSLHNPAVQIVVSLRDPVDRAYSDYWYARRRGWETLSTFEGAIQAGRDRFPKDSRLRERCAYLERSLYIDHLRNLLRYFSRDQVHIFLLEDVQSEPAEVFGRLFSLFDCLDASFAPMLERRHNLAALPRSDVVARSLSSERELPWLRWILRRALPNKTRQRMRSFLVAANEKTFAPPPIALRTRERLVEYFRPYNDLLAELMGRDLAHWNRTRA